MGEAMSIDKQKALGIKAAALVGVGANADDTLAMLAEMDLIKAENEALRKDAGRYRFISKLAWYVDAAAHVYNVCNVNAQWSDQRGHPDTDDIESAIDATMAGGKDQ